MADLGLFLQAASPPRVVLWVSAFFVGLTLLGLLLGFGIERALPQRRIWALPLDPGQLRHELIGNLIFVPITIASFSVALSLRWPHFGDDSLVRGTATFAAIALGFQLFYYALHRAMHQRSLVRFHRWHHVSRVTTPLSAQSMSAVESAAWMLGYVGLPIALSRIAPISAGGWAAYMAYNVLGNIVGHGNVEIVPRWPFVRYTALLSNAFVYHALHHARWNGHYSFAAALMDRLCGTEWDDWPALHARAAAGEPLRSLRERAAGLPAPDAAA